MKRIIKGGSASKRYRSFSSGVSYILPLLLICGMLAPVLTSLAQNSGETVFRSGAGRVQLLELYTSEGCSSCPPAETWLTSLLDDKRLWREFVPVAFHVDYWDNLGWKDRFASRTFTDRQRAYAAEWNTGSIYTPGFVLSGREWSEWRGRGGAGRIVPSKADAASPGVLVAAVRANRTVAVTFTPDGNAATQPKGRETFVALLGCGLKSSVHAGENSGRELKHDFVALSCDKLPLPGDGVEAVFRLPEPPKDLDRLAVAVWVSRPGGLGAEQATGGWLVP